MSDFGNCCSELTNALNGVPHSFFHVEENGVLFLTVGYVTTEQGPGFFDQAVLFCPFCGRELQDADQIRLSHEQSPRLRFLNYMLRELPVDDVSAFDPVEARLGKSLPADYKAFLMASNGGSTKNPLTYVLFYPLEELLPRLEDGHPPDALEFATDDSNGYAFDLRRNASWAGYPVFRYSLGETSRDDCEDVGEDFADFLARILRRLDLPVVL